MNKFKKLFPWGIAIFGTMVASLLLAGCTDLAKEEESPLEKEILSQLPMGWQADTVEYLAFLEEREIVQDGILSHFSFEDSCGVFVIDDLQTFFDAQSEYVSVLEGWIGSIDGNRVVVSFYPDEELPSCLTDLFPVVQFDITNSYDDSDQPTWRASKENISRCIVEKAMCLNGFKLTPPEDSVDSYRVGGEPIIDCRAAGLCCMDAECAPDAMAGTLSGLGGSALESSTFTNNVDEGVVFKSGEWNILEQIAKSTTDMGDTVVFGDGWIMYWDGMSEKPPKSWFVSIAKLLDGTVKDLT